jgi:predicted small lipoprotein YifL
MKKVFAILAIAALASCGGSQEAPAADTTAVVDSAAVVDTTAAADTTKH